VIDNELDSVRRRPENLEGKLARRVGDRVVDRLSRGIEQRDMEALVWSAVYIPRRPGLECLRRE
jgi:hypothetical protein